MIDIVDHMLSGRKPDSVQLARVLKKARESTGVILYFHGGLSTETYVRTELAPLLLRTIFHEDNRAGLHPIFVTYDAGLFESKKILDFLKQQVIRSLIDRLSGKLKAEFGMGFREHNDSDNQEIGRRLLARSRTTKALVEMPPEEALTLLDDDNEQQAISQSLIEQDADYREIADDLIKYSEQNGQAKALINPFKVLRVLGRIAIRFYTRTDHGLTQTVTEEIIRQLEVFGLNVNEFVFHHWDTVYARAEECWQTGESGHALIQGLASIQKDREAQGEKFAIHAMSHSAGSVVICRLLAHLATTSGPALDHVAMVAPAANQTLFEQSVIAYHDCAAAYRFYVLQDTVEYRDKLFGEIYSSSLLYFVSGAAERKGFGDRLLIMERHLQPERWPYYSGNFLGRLKKAELGNPQNVWNYFRQHPEELVITPSEGEPGIETDGSGHEDSKLPNRNPKLAQAVLQFLTGRLVPLDRIRGDG